MNAKVKIGFPITGRAWEFIIVEPSYKKIPLHGWLEKGNEGLRPAYFATDALSLLEYNKTHIRNFEFYHVAALSNESKREPTPWTGDSCKTACALTLAQPDGSQVWTVFQSSMPILLISCNCNPNHEGGLHGALLGPVACSGNEQRDFDCLRQKWAAVAQELMPVMGLVLYHSDAEKLKRALYGKEPIPRTISIEDLDIDVLKTQNWPVLITVKKTDLPLLASKVGLDLRIFKPERIQVEPGFVPGRKESEKNEVTESENISAPQPVESSSSHPQPRQQPQPEKPPVVRIESGSHPITGAPSAGHPWWSLKLRLSITIGMGLMIGGGLATLIYKTRPGFVSSPDLELAPLPQMPDMVTKPTLDMNSPSPVIPAGAKFQDADGTVMVLIVDKKHPSELAPFLIDATEATLATYARCVENHKCADLQWTIENLVQPAMQDRCTWLKRDNPEYSSHPINCLTEKQAEQFCKSQSKQIPSDSQWYLAAIGPSEQPYPWGNLPPTKDKKICWHGISETCATDGTQVAEDISFYGVLGMVGNVGEWTRSYPGNREQIRYIRGGNYSSMSVERLLLQKNPPAHLSRLLNSQDAAQNTVGVRCVGPISRIKSLRRIK